MAAAPAAASACYLGACIYGLYLLSCGLRLKKFLKKDQREELMDADEV